MKQNRNRRKEKRGAVSYIVTYICLIVMLNVSDQVIFPKNSPRNPLPSFIWKISGSAAVKQIGRSTNKTSYFQSENMSPQDTPQW